MFGQKTLSSGRHAHAQAGGEMDWLPGGITVDWSTVPANPTETTLADGDVIPAGVKYIPFGCEVARITASGKFGPYDTGAADGRQTLQPGRCGILNFTVKETDLHADNPPGVLDGGRVYRDRLKRLNAGAYVADGFSAPVAAAMPRVAPVDL